MALRRSNWQPRDRWQSQWEVAHRRACGGAEGVHALHPANFRFARCTAKGAFAAIRCAVSRVSSIKVFGSQSLLTRPHSKASWAVKGRPVKIISLARLSPIALGRFWVPMVPGMMPRVISVKAKRAVVAA